MTTTEAAVGFSAELLREMVEAAGKAPSPDNNQPWAFRTLDNKIHVFHRRERALPSDVADMFSWIALGAAIENLVLAASIHTLMVEVEYHDRPFDSSADGEHVATVRIREGGTADPLHGFIDQRVTNRRLYRKSPLSEAQTAALTEAALSDNDEVFWLTDPADLKNLSKLVAISDKIRFEHQPFHEEFHKVLRYGDDEARQTGDGLELKSLEIPTIAGPLMRWLRPWKRMRLANRFGMSRMFSNYSVKQIVRSGAIGLLVTTEQTDPSYLEAGRSFQRLWLAATAEGLAFQPLGGLPLFLTKLQLQGVESFLPKHAKQLQRLLDPFGKLFPNANGKTLVMLFRVGHAKPPSARSYRYPLCEHTTE